MKVMNGWGKSLKNNYKNKRVMSRRYSSAGPHKGFMCRHYHGAYFVYLFTLLATGAALLNSNSASAAPGTLTISVPDQISLDVLPSSSGTFASASSNITVRTTYAHGYTLGIAAKTANSNALINTSDSSKTIPSITSAISESTFSGNTSYNNKWGYSPSKYNSTTNTNYLVAPTSTTMATLDKTSAANSTDNTYTIKLGARIDATLTPGTYENTFVFTVMPNATPYTINYNKNTTDTVTNMPTPNPQTGETFATTVNISNTVPARDGYLFKGWCTVAVADGATCSGTTYNPDGGGTSLSWTIDQTAVTNTLNLYAMWEAYAPGECTNRETCMQTLSSCPNADTLVTDARDGKVYTVRSINGNCWMVQNLAIAKGSVLTNTLSNVGPNTYTIPSTDLSSGNSYTEGRSHEGSSGKSGSGYWYNFCAASAGTVCDRVKADSIYDICPAGWRIPSTTDYESISSSSAEFAPVPTGYYSGGTLRATDQRRHWASEAFSEYYQYFYYTGASGGIIEPGYRYFGYPVRCVKKKQFMQDMTSSSLKWLIPNVGDSIDLIDKRDGETYKVARLADGKVWMLDNLRLDPTTVDLTKLQTLSNASATTIAYLKNGGGSSPYPATGVNTTWASSSDDKYDEPKVVTTYKDTTATSYGAGSGKIGVYYNYCAASAGSYCYPSSSGTGNATEDLCPAGWRIPTGNTAGEYGVLKSNYYTDTTASNIGSYQYALSIPLSGSFRSGSAYYQGSGGSFWSSTRGATNIMYYLYANSSNVDPTYNYSRGYGLSIRCILK